jgi:hypothetical protein
VSAGIDQGGLKLCHYQTRINAIKLTWVKRLTSSTIHKLMDKKTLSIIIVNNKDQNYKFNFQQKIVNLKTTLEIWKQRNLTLKGKVTIIKSIALAPLIYISSIVDTPDKPKSMQ